MTPQTVCRRRRTSAYRRLRPQNCAGEASSVRGEGSSSHAARDWSPVPFGFLTEPMPLPWSHELPWPGASALPEPVSSTSSPLLSCPPCVAPFEGSNRAQTHLVVALRRGPPPRSDARRRVSPSVRRKESRPLISSSTTQIRL